MCTKVFLNDGTLTTVADFETYFGIDATSLVHNEYKVFEPNGCLCQIDVDKHLKSHQGFLKHEDNFWEKTNFYC